MLITGKPKAGRTENGLGRIDTHDLLHHFETGNSPAYFLITSSKLLLFSFVSFPMSHLQTIHIAQDISSSSCGRFCTSNNDSSNSSFQPFVVLSLIIDSPAIFKVSMFLKTVQLLISNFSASCKAAFSFTNG